MHGARVGVSRGYVDSAGCGKGVVRDGVKRALCRGLDVEVLGGG